MRPWYLELRFSPGLKIDEKRLPQDGRFNFATAEQEIDLRVSTLPTINGENRDAFA
jgi:type IV pilus assembly protein PilB